MKQLKSLLGDSLIYGLGSFLLKATQIFILPLILLFLNKEEFGKLDYFLNIKNVLMIVFGWGILTSIFKYSSIGEQRDSNPFNGFLVILTIASISTVIVSVLSLFILSIKEYWDHYVFILIISTFWAFLTIPLGIYRQKRKPKSYIFLNSIYTIVFLGTSYLFITLTTQNYKSILWGHSLAAILSFVVGVFGIRKYVFLKFDFSQYKQMFNFGFSILLNSISFVVILASTRFFLKLNGTFEDVGILGMSQRLSLFVGALLISPFTLAWLPFVKANFEKKDFIEITNRVFTGFLWLGLLFCFTLEFLQKDLFLLIKNKEYLVSLNYVLPFSLSYFVQGLYYIFIAGVFLSGKTLHYKIIGISGPLFNLMLYALFYRILSLEVVSYITLASFIYTMILAFYFGNKNIGIELFKKRNLFILLLYITLFISLLFLPQYNTFSIIVLGIKLFVILLLFSVHFFNEKKVIKN